MCDRPISPMNRDHKLRATRTRRIANRAPSMCASSSAEWPETAAADPDSSVDMEQQMHGGGPQQNNEQ